jgi:hypothetical protein
MIKKVTKKPVAKKVVAKKVVKKAVPKMQDGGKIDKLTKDKLKRAGVSKEEYSRVMNDNSKMPTRAAGRVTMPEKLLAPQLPYESFDPQTTASTIARRRLNRSVNQAVTIAAVNAGVLPKWAKGEEIFNFTSDLKEYLSKNPKVLDEMDEFTKQRIAEKGRMPTFKKGGTKTTATKKVVMRKGGKVTKGMGFKAAQKQIAKKQGLSMERAGAILAAGARKASPAAKRKNPNLKKVKG